MIPIQEKKTRESFIETRSRILYIFSLAVLITIAAFSYQWSAFEFHLADGQVAAQTVRVVNSNGRATKRTSSEEFGYGVVSYQEEHISQNERDNFHIQDNVSISSQEHDNTRNISEETTVTSIRDIDVCSSDLAKIKKQTLPFLDDVDRMQSFDNHFVYRAYYDNRPSLKPTIHIISILPTNETTVICYVHSHNTNNGKEKMVSIKGEYWSIHNQEAKSEVHSAFLDCTLPDRDWKPEFVLLTTKRCGTPVAALAVHDIHQQTKKYNYTVCLHQALFNVKMSSMPRILEWIAVNRVFGADHFVIYYLKSTEQIASYLQPLVKVGLVETHFWDYYREGRHFEDFNGQKALLNDCIYRFMHTSDRILLLDFDEYPTPQAHPNWSTMLAKSPCADAASVFFLNSFFLLGLADSAGGSDYKLNVLLKDKRQEDFNKCGRRSKLLVHPPDILASSIHKLYRLVGDKTRKDECCLPTDVGFLHHYRGMTGKTNTTIVVDKRMKKFQAEIETSVKEIYAVLGRDIKELHV